MKKSGPLLVALTGAMILLASFVIPLHTASYDPPQDIPDSVWAVLEKSCYDCHSTDGNGMAKAKLNFDKWNDYAADKQLAKAKDICDELENEKMPPSKYRKNNPEAVPTAEEVARVCNWVIQLEK